MRTWLIKIIRILHIGIVFFVIFGFLGPTNKLLLVHLVFVPLMLLHWKTNNNRCFLTNLEYRLKGIPLKSIETEDGFVKSLLRLFKKQLPEDSAIRRWIYIVTLSCWLITGLRLLLS